MTMNYGGSGGVRTAAAGGTPEAVWARAAQSLKAELGDAIYGSWLGQAAVREDADRTLVLVTPTTTARDWVRRNAWRRIGDLWARNDPLRRPLGLKSRAEFDAEVRECAGEAEPPAPAARLAIAGAGGGDRTGGEAPASQRSPGRGAPLQERFTFDSFVVGPANDFAYAVARRVAAWSDEHFNPIIFHSPYGYGKTHLLNAIAWEAARNAPDKTVIYMTAERFLAGFVKAMMDRSGPAFKEALRGADLLLVDDAHFVIGKQNSQEELFHTIAALTQDGRRVVLTTDRPPTALTDMDPRLRSHLQAGLVCGIEPADRTLRLGILERKLDQLGRQSAAGALTARSEVLAFLADRFTDSVRELEGALNTLVARAGPAVAEIGVEQAQAMLGAHLRGAEKRITVDQIQKAVAEHYGLTQADLISQRRSRSVARPRQAAMWLAKQLTDRSFPDIGRRTGGCDHTTVLHGVRRIEALRQEDAQLARDLEVLTRKLRG